MTRRSTSQKKLDALAFPVELKVLVPPGGLGSQVNAMQHWLTQNLDPAAFASHGGGSNRAGFFTTYYFRDTATADRFVQAFGLELADGTRVPSTD